MAPPLAAAAFGYRIRWRGAGTVADGHYCRRGRALPPPLPGASAAPNGGGRPFYAAAATGCRRRHLPAPLSEYYRLRGRPPPPRPSLAALDTNHRRRCLPYIRPGAAPAAAGCCSRGGFLRRWMPPSQALCCRCCGRTLPLLPPPAAALDAAPVLVVGCRLRLPGDNARCRPCWLSDATVGRCWCPSCAEFWPIRTTTQSHEDGVMPMACLCPGSNP